MKISRAPLSRKRETRFASTKLDENHLSAGLWPGETKDREFFKYIREKYSRDAK